MTLGIDYNDTTQAAKVDSRPYTVSMSCPTGEMVRPLNMSQMAFTKEQVTVQVYTVYSMVACYYSGHSETKSECQAKDLSLR